MVRSWCVLFAFLLAAPATALAHPQPLGPIWSSGSNAVVVTPCPAGGGDYDLTCRAIAVRQGGRVQQLGAGYIVARLLWTRSAGEPGPDALIVGDGGGSGGYGDLFAVTLGPALQVRKLSGERIVEATVRPGPGPLRIELPFNVEHFNGAPDAGALIVPLPLGWAGDDFAVDFDELAGRPFPPNDLHFRRFAARSELEDWRENSFPVGHGTPITGQGLLELMLAGHADEAQATLHRAWPRQHEDLRLPMSGEDAFWGELCKAVVRNPYWRRFGLSRLPHAELIEAGAAAAP